MRRRSCEPVRPAWWPDNEPWPPLDQAHQWRHRRTRFFRRFVWLGLAVLMLSVGGALALAWLLAAKLGMVTATEHGGALALLVGGMTGALVAAFALAGLLRRVGMPLGAVMDAAERVSGGDYSVRVALHGPPPVRALARAFNTMTERLQNHDRQRRDLMADVAHELRTPLTVIQGKLEGLIDGVYARDTEQLKEVLEEAHVLSRLVEDLRTLALSESGALTLQKEPTDLGGLARDVAHTFAPDAAARGVTIEVEAPADPAPVVVDPLRIREVVSNLLANALRSTQSGGSIDVRVSAISSGGVSVEIRDTGTGMTPDDIAHAFDRFYKGPESRGSGLGLTIVRNLVVAHGGEIRVSSEPGQGTTVTFTLPRLPAAVSADA